MKAPSPTVRIVLRSECECRNLPFFDPKSVTAGWLGSRTKRISRESMIPHFLVESDS